jgi:hypothetical protein
VTAAEDSSARTLPEEAAHGRSWRTPFLALGGVSLAIGALFALAVVLAAAAYMLA